MNAAHAGRGRGPRRADRVENPRDECGDLTSAPIADQCVFAEADIRKLKRRNHGSDFRLSAVTKARLEAFSDGVIAILITIMVLELKVPHASDWNALGPLVPILSTYLMSFVVLGIYWNNHHHMLHAVERINGSILWANLHLLFWLSLIPFVTAWMGENHFHQVPTAAYGIVMLLSAVAYLILERRIIAFQGPLSKLKAAIGKEVKGYVSMALYVAAILLAFVDPRISIALFVTVLLMWLVPDRRIERRV